MAKKPNQENLKKYLARIEAAEKWRDSYFRDLWLRCYKRWRNWVEQYYTDTTKKKVDADKSNISVPITFIQVETILPRLLETTFATRPYVSVLPRKGEKYMANAKKMETLLDYQMNEKMDLRGRFHEGLKELCIYGTCVAFTPWRYDTKRIIRKQYREVMDPETTQPLMSEVMGENGMVMMGENGTPQMQPVMDWQPTAVNETIFDDPDAQFIDLGLFVVDPQSTTIDDARFAGHPEYVTKSEIEKRIEAGIIPPISAKDWKKIGRDEQTNKARDYRQKAIGLPTSESGKADEEGYSDELTLYELFHYWEDDLHCVIINRVFLAVEEENPYWHKQKPYDKAVYTLVPKEFYGMGIPESINDLHDELNTERNMRIDFRKFLLRRMWSVKRGATIDERELKWRQNGIIHVDQHDDIKTVETPDASVLSSFTEEDQITRNIQDTTGGQDVILGTSNAAETATGTMTKDNNASWRFKIIIGTIEKQLLVGISQKWMALNQQYIDDVRMIRVTGEDGNETWPDVTPEDIQGEFDLIAAGTSVEPLANKEADKQRKVELYNAVKGDPLFEQFPEKRRNLLKEIFTAFGMKNTDMFLPTDEELMQMLQVQSDQVNAEQDLANAEVEAKLGGGANTAAQSEVDNIQNILG